ncbi:MAG TPA: hypothetical protein VGX50_05630, partial [Longimicrobium sp.]|nr:hypothetical protein [Longimicrobium sp.]
ILQPLKELTALLQERVMVVEDAVEAFKPGALVAAKVEPYLKGFFDKLDEFRPSDLLKPIKEALASLQTAVGQLDPQRLVDQLQGAHAQLRELVDALGPTGLNARIGEAADTVTRQINDLRDVHLEGLLKTVRENVSLTRLLQGTGVQEIAKAGFWDQLRVILAGEYLGRITDTVDEVQKRLTDDAGTLSFPVEAAAAMGAVSKEVEAQRTATATPYRTAANALRTALGTAGEQVAALERRRAELLAGGTVVRREVREVLEQMDLRPLTELADALRGVAELGADALADRLNAVAAVLTPESEAKLGAVTEATIRDAIPGIFEKQIAGPVRQLVTRTQNALEPFGTGVAAIQGFLDDTLVKLPQKVDAAVGEVLDAVKSTLGRTADEIIGTIKTTRDTITTTIQAIHEQVLTQVEAFDPAYVLNSFGATDVSDEELRALAERVFSPQPDPAATLLRARLSKEQADLVANKVGDYAAVLRAALNGALRDEDFANKLLVDARDRLAAEQRNREARVQAAQGDERTEARKALLRAHALEWQLNAAEQALTLERKRDAAEPVGKRPAPRTTAATIRLNRVLLELSFPDQLRAGVMGLHPYLVALVGALYPAESVARLDASYAELIEKLRGLP